MGDTKKNSLCVFFLLICFWLAVYLMNHPLIKCNWGTGGPDLMAAVAKSGKSCILGGSGNTPVIIDETANIPEAVHSILLSKQFDNGMPCPTESCMIIVDQVYDQVLQEFQRRGLCACVCVCVPVSFSFIFFVQC